MSKQSSIEWLVNQVEDFIGLIPVDIIEKAQQMHKEEIMEAHYAPKYGCFSEQYYQETYEQTVTNCNHLSSPKTSDN